MISLVFFRFSVLDRHILALVFNKYTLRGYCRNFPQGSISDMISDVSTGIGYVFQNLENYGGDPNM